MKHTIYWGGSLFNGINVAFAYSDLTNSLVMVGNDFVRRRGAKRVSPDTFINALKELGASIASETK